MRWRWVRNVAAVVVLMAWTAGVRAHPVVSTVGLVKVTSDGHVQVTIIHDALAFALNDTSARIGDPPMLALVYGPEEDLAAAFADGRERLGSGMRIWVDGKQTEFQVVQAPDLAAARQWKIEHPTRQLPCKMDYVISAELPKGAAKMVLRFPAVLSDVILSVDRPGVEPANLPLGAGEVSPEIDIRMATGGAASPTENPDSVVGVAWRYVKLGYRHIMPEGTDHALFVLGLFLLTPRVKALLWQITAFTIAHSLTLTLATLHLVSIPASIVEPTIALTIAFIGVENLFAKKVHAWRPAVAFIFGLVHGLGFATGLMEIGLPTGQLAAGLVAFNVGVEGGHLTVLAAAFLVLGWWRNKPWYRKRVAMPISMVIAAIALFWMVQRIVQGA